MAGLVDPDPVQPHLARRGRRLGQAAGAIEAGAEQPFVQTARSSDRVNAARPAKGELGSGGGFFGARGLSRRARLFLRAPPDRLGVRRPPPSASPARPARCALRPCRCPAATRAWVSNVSASLPLASAFSSSSSSRSSMSKRMARPPITAKPAGLQRGGVAALVDGEGGEAGRGRRRRRVLLASTRPTAGSASAAASGRSSLGR